MATQRFYDSAGVIKYVRRMMGKQSQEQFAAAVGLSTSVLSELLTGRRSPSDNTLAKLGLRRIERFEPLSRGDNGKQG